MYSKLKDFIIGFVALCGALGAIHNYMEEHSDKKAKEKESYEALRSIAREETDLHEVYINKLHLEVRWSNKKQGFYWFYDQYVKKVFWSDVANDFYYDEGTIRTYLKQINK